jgi:hypothetical protein
MGQPVKLSDTLVLDARLCGEITERSIAGQIEYWAGLGRAIEVLLRGDAALALRRVAAAKPFSRCLKEVGTAKGQKRLAQVLHQRPFPHYEAAPRRPGHVIRIEEDGTRTIGRFRNRRFVTSR